MCVCGSRPSWPVSCLLDAQCGLVVPRTVAQVTAAMPARRRLAAALNRHCNQRCAANTGPTGSGSACYCG
ncbi:protein of unknown function (plasmid) [Cupriavidus neocaledonicus]|uniref:Uncharacterized protein n=1 Tax=Cupriavidus neocaledonicus TaxID=1040979 RepID=A0A375HSL3_9BURK|nr:hypothetical protein CBM2605_B10206 [Cupriavidus neocaledonicus]SPD61159.1 protein of unknown function [Cupriavidus neocaledonicus]